MQGRHSDRTGCRRHASRSPSRARVETPGAARGPSRGQPMSPGRKSAVRSRRFVGQRLRIGSGRVRIIDALRYCSSADPVRGRRRHGRLVARIEQFDGKAVRGLGHQLRGRRTFEHALDQTWQSTRGCGSEIDRREGSAHDHGVPDCHSGGSADIAPIWPIPSTLGQVYGSTSIPAVSTRASASRRRVPPMMRSGRDLGQRTSTKPARQARMRQRQPRRVERSRRSRGCRCRACAGPSAARGTVPADLRSTFCACAPEVARRQPGLNHDAEVDERRLVFDAPRRGSIFTRARL